MNEEATHELEFSRKYDREHAERYFYKHQRGIGRRLSNWRENSMARKALALAGNPKSVLDLPSGTGRFWELLCEEPDRKIVAADNSEDMINTGLRLRPPKISSRIEGFSCSAFEIPKPDNFVESVFCMRLIHHIGEREDRIKMFREFSRVATDTVLVSLWVDGNYKAMRRSSHERKRARHKYQNRFLITRQDIESDFEQAGLTVIGHVDFLKFYSMWRVYVCKVK